MQPFLLLMVVLGVFHCFSIDVSRVFVFASFEAFSQFPYIQLRRLHFGRSMCIPFRFWMCHLVLIYEAHFYICISFLL